MPATVEPLSTSGS